MGMMGAGYPLWLVLQNIVVSRFLIRIIVCSLCVTEVALPLFLSPWRLCHIIEVAMAEDWEASSVHQSDDMDKIFNNSLLHRLCVDTKNGDLPSVLELQ